MLQLRISIQCCIRSRVFQDKSSRGLSLWSLAARLFNLTLKLNVHKNDFVSTMNSSAGLFPSSHFYKLGCAYNPQISSTQSNHYGQTIRSSCFSHAHNELGTGVRYYRLQSFYNLTDICSKVYLIPLTPIYVTGTHSNVTSKNSPGGNLPWMSLLNS